MVRKVIFYFAFTFLSLSLQAKDVPAPLKGNAAFVSDYSHVLGPAQLETLRNKLKDYYDSTSSQIAILIEPSVGEEDPFDYSLKVAREWGIGEGDKNNGILVYIATADRKIFIQVGDGLEGAIPDMLVARIIDGEIKPAFRAGNYFEGIDKAVDQLIGYASGEFVYSARPKNGFPSWIIVVIIIILLIIFTGFGNNMNRTYGDHNPYTRGGPFIGGGFGGFGGGGSSSGGGFGGFGGGGFSGGGAGGSW